MEGLEILQLIVRLGFVYVVLNAFYRYYLRKKGDQ